MKAPRAQYRRRWCALCAVDGDSGLQRVAEAMGQVVHSLGGEMEFGVNVDSIKESSANVFVAAGERHWTAKRLVFARDFSQTVWQGSPDASIMIRLFPFAVIRSASAQ